MNNLISDLTGIAINYFPSYREEHAQGGEQIGSTTLVNEDAPLAGASRAPQKEEVTRYACFKITEAHGSPMLVWLARLGKRKILFLGGEPTEIVSR